MGIKPSVFHNLPVIRSLDTNLVLSVFPQRIQMVFYQPHYDLVGFHLGELKIAVAVPFGEEPFLEKGGDEISGLPGACADCGHRAGAYGAVTGNGIRRRRRIV